MWVLVRNWAYENDVKAVLQRHGLEHNKISDVSAEALLSLLQEADVMLTHVERTETDAGAYALVLGVDRRGKSFRAR